MFVGLLHLRLSLGKICSLKAKRQVLKSLKDRLRNRFNVAIAETGFLDKWQLSELSLATIGTSKEYINTNLSNILNFVRSFNGVIILESEQEIL
jgi:hypothetical protein